MFLKNTNILQEWLGKKPAVCTKYRKKITICYQHVSFPPEYWDDVIFSDERKIMLYYHDEPQRAWPKTLKALEKKSYSYSKVWKTSRNGMGWYIQQGSWYNQDFG